MLRKSISDRRKRLRNNVEERNWVTTTSRRMRRRWKRRKREREKETLLPLRKMRNQRDLVPS